MPINATLHPFLNGGVELKVNVKGNNACECFDSAVRQYPAIEKQLSEKKAC